MGAALTYARRYALFALVGIAGEDDLDAPDVAAPAPSPADPRSGNGPRAKPERGVLQRQPVLSPQDSADLRDAMLAELTHLSSDQDLLAWAQNALARKNTLLEADARALETAYQEKLNQAILPQPAAAAVDIADAAASSNQAASHDASAALTIAKQPVRKRSKAHLLLVRGQPCVVCGQSPCDAHHLKFAQPRALSRKVSDEFTVPLCHAHHQDLHRYGNEKAWWANLKIDPLPLAKQLWESSPSQSSGSPAAVFASESIVGSEGLAV
jgi:hypothetical protein